MCVVLCSIGFRGRIYRKFSLTVFWNYCFLTSTRTMLRRKLLFSSRRPLFTFLRFLDQRNKLSFSGFLHIIMLRVGYNLKKQEVLNTTPCAQKVQKTTKKPKFCMKTFFSIDNFFKKDFYFVDRTEKQKSGTKVLSYVQVLYPFQPKMCWKWHSCAFFGTIWANFK